MFPLKFQGLINPAQMNLLSLLQGKKADNQPDLGQMADKVGLFDRVFNSARAESTAASPQAAGADQAATLLFELAASLGNSKVSPEWDSVKVDGQNLSDKMLSLFGLLANADAQTKNDPQITKLAQEIDDFVRSETPTSSNIRTAFEMLEKLKEMIEGGSEGKTPPPALPILQPIEGGKESPPNPVGGIGATPGTELPPTVPAPDATIEDAMEAASDIITNLSVRSSPYGDWKARVSPDGERITDSFKKVHDQLKFSQLPQKEINAITAELKSMADEMETNRYPDDAAFEKMLGRVKGLVTRLDEAPKSFVSPEWDAIKVDGKSISDGVFDIAVALEKPGLREKLGTRYNELNNKLGDLIANEQPSEKTVKAAFALINEIKDMIAAAK
jgi:hypothetical protein